ncbi:hypothetical protein [Streptomyces sp. NPDC087294]
MLCLFGSAAPPVFDVGRVIEDAQARRELDGIRYAIRLAEA